MCCENENCKCEEKCTECKCSIIIDSENEEDIKVELGND